jgi:hypothetical protein
MCDNRPARMLKRVAALPARIRCMYMQRVLVVKHINVKEKI